MNDLIGQPTYRRIAAELRSRIIQGYFKIGDPIPSTAQLCTEFAVSSTSVRAAVSELRNEGIVRGHPGKAVYVITTPTTALQEDHANLADLTSDLDGDPDQIRDIKRRVQATPGEISELHRDISALRKQIATLQAHLQDQLGQTRGSAT